MAAFGDFHLVSGAGWSVYWRIAALAGGGLEVWFADFRGRRVLWRGTAPFALVPYHGRNPTFKDGLNPACGGAHFYALRHNAPNAWNNSSFFAAVDTDAVVVDVEPATDFEPARLMISAKFQCGWYQYVIAGSSMPMERSTPTWRWVVSCTLAGPMPPMCIISTSRSISISTVSPAMSPRSLITRAWTTRRATNGSW